ncbi:hypothetical protein N7G274_005813 [Stereocaulon virgatum]|uniref:Major facilitator superfamily (MFS) profile domain-containing protein n=1 Tax=Stereocaulon virgatum TaxID=373712 RepID=A0ABR4A944_9LECA
MMVRKTLGIRIAAIGMIYGFFHEGGFYTILYASPIYFQAGGDLSPAQAGIRKIPILMCCGIGSIAAGLFVSKHKHFVPLMVWASGGGCIATGLLDMLDVISPSFHWTGFQVLAGLAFGTGLPLAIIAGQAHVTNEDLPSATAMLLCKFPSRNHRYHPSLTLYGLLLCWLRPSAASRPIHSRQLTPDLLAIFYANR